MKNVFLGIFSALALLAGAPLSAQAQNTIKVVGTCGTATYTAGKMNYPTQDTSGNACSSATLSGTVTATTTATASSAPTPVVAGTGKPLNIGLFSNLFITSVTPAGAAVDLTAPSGIFGKDGATVMSTSNAFADQLQTQTDTVMVGGVNIKEINAVTPLMGAGVTGTGSQRVTAAQDTTTIAGSAPGTAGTPSANVVSVQGVTSGTPLVITNSAAATGGATPSHAIVAANTTSVSIDASPGTLYSVQVFNNSATIAYLKLYDAAQGSTTCGSGTPKKVILIPASTSGAGAVISLGGSSGVAFATAITRCVTTGIADNDTGAPAASTYLVEADFK